MKDRCVQGNKCFGIEGLRDLVRSEVWLKTHFRSKKILCDDKVKVVAMAIAKVLWNLRSEKAMNN